MLKKVRRNSSICTKSELGLFWAETHPPSKFRGNWLCSFCVVLLTNQQSNTTSSKLVRIRQIHQILLTFYLFPNLG